MQRTRSLIRCVRWPASPRVMFRKKESIDMIRGEFIRGDGLVLPNNITSYGAELLLAAALQGVATTLNMCLGKCNPKVDLDLNELNEPTIGTGGYARQSLSQDDIDWLTSGELNGERFIETRAVIVLPTGADRRRGGSGKSVTVRVDLGGGRLIKKKHN